MGPGRASAILGARGSHFWAFLSVGGGLPQAPGQGEARLALEPLFPGETSAGSLPGQHGAPWRLGSKPEGMLGKEGELRPWPQGLPAQGPGDMSAATELSGGGPAWRRAERAPCPAAPPLCTGPCPPKASYAALECTVCWPHPADHRVAASWPCSAALSQPGPQGQSHGPAQSMMGGGWAAMPGARYPIRQGGPAMPVPADIAECHQVGTEDWGGEGQVLAM